MRFVAERGQPLAIRSTHHARKCRLVSSGPYRKGFKLFWRWKSKPGRLRLPRSVRELIAQIVHEGPNWGQARVASELSEDYVSRTVRAYWPSEPDRRSRRTASQHWQKFVRNHARSILACDFLVVVTARFRVLYVFVIMERPCPGCKYFKKALTQAGMLCDGPK